MSDLISRSALLRKTETMHDGMKCCLAVNEKYIYNAPAVDAVPVVHGRWEKDPDMRRMSGHIYDYRCSVCHSSAHKGIYNNKDRFTNYCSNCGAKMDNLEKIKCQGS